MMAERFGWTLDYVDSLPMSRLFEFLQIEDARIKAMKTKEQRRGKK